MKRTFLYFALLATAIFVVSCSKKPAYTTKTLPSGRTVKIASIMKMFFSKGDPALMLKYYTDINIDNTLELQDEVEEIWELFQIDVEKAGLNFAIISAVEMPQGIIFKTRGFNFVFEKHESGDWILTNDQKNSDNKESLK
jgi:hypothetical protein